MAGGILPDHGHVISVRRVTYGEGQDFRGSGKTRTDRRGHDAAGPAVGLVELVFPVGIDLNQGAFVNLDPSGPMRIIHHAHDGAGKFRSEVHWGSAGRRYAPKMIRG